MDNDNFAQLGDIIGASNREISDKLGQIDKTTAKALVDHNAETVRVSEHQFRSIRKWSITSLVLATLTFLVLVLFTIAFFKFAIIVRI